MVKISRLTILLFFCEVFPQSISHSANLPAKAWKSLSIGSTFHLAESAAKALRAFQKLSINYQMINNIEHRSGQPMCNCFSIIFDCFSFRFGEIDQNSSAFRFWLLNSINSPTRDPSPAEQAKWSAVRFMDSISWGNLFKTHLREWENN